MGLIAKAIEAIGKFLPDPQAKAQAQLALLQLQQASEFKEIDAALLAAGQQNDINKAEATNPNVFVSGWRPFIGWVCGTGLAMQFIVGPFVTWGAALNGHPVAFPQLDMGTLLTLLLGMLGIGAMRTVEKLKDKA